jgi:lipopolysaccharide export system protein LptA
MSARRAEITTAIKSAMAVMVMLTGLGASFTAHAEQADRDKPLVYAADHLSYDDLKQTTILTGNVEITKGTILLRGDRAEIHQDPEGYTYATATRTTGLAYIREKRDGLNEYFEGTARRIDYDGKEDVSTLIGQATARRLQGLTTPIDEVHGDKIRYDGKTSYYTATSGGSTSSSGKVNSGGRVHGMIAPSSVTPAASPPASGQVTGTINGTGRAPVTLAPASTLGGEK